MNLDTLALSWYWNWTQLYSFRAALICANLLRWGPSLTCNTSYFPWKKYIPSHLAFSHQHLHQSEFVPIHCRACVQHTAKVSTPAIKHALLSSRMPCLTRISPCVLSHSDILVGPYDYVPNMGNCVCMCDHACWVSLCPLATRYCVLLFATTHV